MLRQTIKPVRNTGSLSCCKLSPFCGGRAPVSCGRARIETMKGFDTKTVNKYLEKEDWIEEKPPLAQARGSKLRYLIKT